MAASQAPLVLLGGTGASAALCRLDPAFSPLRDRFGPAKVEDGQDPFASVVQAITHQQLSLAAGRTVYSRVERLCGGHVRPKRLAKATAEELRGCGLSRPKAGYVQDLARRTQDGEIAFEALRQKPDEAVIEELTRIKGIGVWTAQMLLIFTFHRPDVLPTLDLGVRDGARIVFGRKGRPTELGLTRLAARWRPYRSVASWYLWRERDRLVRPAPRASSV